MVVQENLLSMLLLTRTFSSIYVYSARIVLAHATTERLISCYRVVNIQKILGSDRGLTL